MRGAKCVVEHVVDEMVVVHSPGPVLAAAAERTGASAHARRTPHLGLHRAGRKAVVGSLGPEDARRTVVVGVAVVGTARAEEGRTAAAEEVAGNSRPEVAVLFEVRLHPVDSSFDI